MSAEGPVVVTGFAVAGAAVGRAAEYLSEETKIKMIKKKWDKENKIKIKKSFCTCNWKYKFHVLAN